MIFSYIENYVIDIGTSNKNTKQIFISSCLKLNKCEFYTYPFGRTKTKYQDLDLFNYKIVEIIPQISNINYYLFTITRSDKIDINNCPHNTNYFYDQGWNINIRVLCVPVIKSFESCLINNLIPKNYGLIKSNLHNGNKCFKAGIVVPIFSRNDYLEKFFKSLSNTDLTNCIVVLIDESMTKDIDDDKVNVRKAVQNYTHPNANIIKIFKNTHGNMFDSILIGLDLISPLCKYVSTIDSDTIHTYDWINSCINTYLEVESDYSHKPILLSGFNTTNTGRHPIIETTDKYIIKTSVGGCHMFFTPKMYYNIIRKTLISYKWDTNIVDSLRKQNGIVVTTKPSVIEHIGIKSSGHRKDKKEKVTIYDISDDFILN
tara:strand:- start:217 stop:1335 length:1119 start_codon:yes stop_codon:yes gene_type:complete